MHAQRNTILIILLFITCLIFMEWQGDKSKNIEVLNESLTSITKTNSNNTNSQNIITVNTDLYDLEIQLSTGDITKVDLKDQKEEVDSNENFHLLKSSEDFSYTAKSYLILNGNKFFGPYKSSQKSYEMVGNSLKVTLSSVDNNNVEINKIFTFTKGKHIIDVSYEIKNPSQEYKVQTFSYLEQTAIDKSLEGGMFGTGAYRGIAYSTDDTRYTKTSLEDVAESAKIEKIISKKGGWVSMIQHYFVASWIGDINSNNTIVLESSNNANNAVAGLLSSSFTITNNESISIGNRLWLGPKNQEEMKNTANNLELTVDYGWLSFLSFMFFWFMQKIHAVLIFVGIDNSMGAWGFSIIILTLLVRTALYPLTKHQYVSMAKMRLIAPKLQALKEKYKDDRQLFTQEMLALYQKEKVKPLSGCLPILIQMPIFIALYWTFMESVELRHSPFILWIQDLSTQDPYYVLPIFMGITMFLIQKISPTPVTDPMQKKIMTIIPVVFTFMFCTFPAGLTLYWVVSNIVTIVHQALIIKELEKKGLRTQPASNNH